MRYRVSVADEAKKQANEKDGWWHRHRPDAPNTFWNEFIQALRDLETTKVTPGVPVRRAGVRGLRRSLLPKSLVHLYFVCDEENGTLRVWAVWGAVRRRGPPIPKSARR